MLSSLALVARGLQPEAEEMLYSALVLDTDRPEALHQAFDTLSTNPQKAAFVRFLVVETVFIDQLNSDDSVTHDNSSETSQDHRIALGKALISVLPKLISLKDLRLKFDYWYDDSSSILQSVFFPSSPATQGLHDW
ncbi:hypothetical protein H0H93_002472 [Arthromyces matolae]|nr:hypothetical protein H0H93_002472 [Arthromyces matolae]